MLLFRLLIICETRSVIGRNKTLLPSFSKSSKNVNPAQSTINSCLEFPLQTLLGLVRIRITQSKLGIQSSLNIKPSSEYGPWSRKAFSQKSDLELGKLKTGLGTAKIYYVVSYHIDLRCCIGNVAKLEYICFLPQTLFDQGR